MPEKTLQHFAAAGHPPAPMRADGGDAEATIARYAAVGVDVDALAAQLQREGAAAFVASWRDLLQRIAAKSAALSAS